MFAWRSKPSRCAWHGPREVTQGAPSSRPTWSTQAPAREPSAIRPWIDALLIPARARASAARLLPIETEDGTHRDAENRAAELVIPGKEVAQSARQAEDPLAHRHRRKDVVDQLCGVRRHAAAAAARTEAPSFAGERHEPLERAVVAPNPRKAARERAAGQELAELALDEPRQTVPVAVIVGLAEERFQILADDAMEDRALCVSGLIARGAHERRASEVRSVRPGRQTAAAAPPSAAGPRNTAW